jgi:fructose transport system permease protein
MSETGSPVTNDAAVDPDEGSAAAEFADRTLSLWQRFQVLLHTHTYLSALIVLAISYLVFGAINPNFYSPFNQSTMIKNVAVIAVLAIGQTLIILTAGIDLSVGAISLLSMMLSAKLFAEQGWNPLFSIFVGLSLGLLCGLLNGSLVTILQLPPFIVTLGTLGIFQAAMLLYTSGKTVLGEKLSQAHLLPGEAPLTFLADERGFGGFKVFWAVVIMLALYCLMSFVLSQTAWGRHVYAVGDDPEAARLAGIRVNRVLLSVYGLAGVFYAIGGWMNSGLNEVASPNLLTDANLDSITAAAIGGTSLFGGRGRLVGTLLGALIVGVFDRGLSLAQVDQNWRLLAVGILIIVAVGADQWIRRVKV